MADISQINVNEIFYNIKDDAARIQKVEMPVASANLLGKIYQFVGTTGTYTNGYFYKCVEGTTAGTYEWKLHNVQPGGSGSSVQSDWGQTDSTADDYIKNKPDLSTKQDVIQVSSMPEASSSLIDKVYQYIGSTTSDYIAGNFYACKSYSASGTTFYRWVQVFGTAAYKTVPASGDASSTQVVMGNDSRLTDARTPTAHSHDAATTSAAGFMSTADKTKLNGIASNATANTIFIKTATLASTDWTGASAPYSQMVSVSDILNTDTPFVDISVSDTAATGIDQIEQFGYISKATTGSGSMTFYCYEEKPDINLTVNIKVVR